MLIPGKMFLRTPGCESNNILPRGPDRKPSLLVKAQLREPTLDISSSNVHIIFLLDPGKMVSSVPSGGGMIFPKQDGII